MVAIFKERQEMDELISEEVNLLWDFQDAVENLKLVLDQEDPVPDKVMAELHEVTSCYIAWRDALAKPVVEMLD